MHRSCILIALSLLYTQTILFAAGESFINYNGNNLLVKQWINAIKCNNRTIIAKLIKTHGINKPLAQGWTALHLAAELGSEPVVSLLLTQKGIKVNAQSDSGTTALMIAAHQHNDPIVILLLDMPGIDVNARIGEESLSLLHIATLRKKIGLVDLILQNPNLMPNIKDSSGQTALFDAVTVGNPKIISLLLESGALDINSQDNDGNTAFHWACNAGYFDMVKLLLQDPQLNPNIRNKQGKTALHCTINEGHTEITAFLLDSDKIKLDIPDNDGVTAIQLGIDSRKESLVDLVIQVNKLREKLLDAIKQNDQNILFPLIKRLGFDITDHDGNTALHKAFESNNIALALGLLRASEDPRNLFMIFNKKGQTPIELISPTSDLFLICFNLAYAQQYKKSKACAYCAKENCIMLCGKCKAVYYCSPACQKKDWRAHKKICIK